MTHKFWKRRLPAAVLAVSFALAMAACRRETLPEQTAQVQTAQTLPAGAVEYSGRYYVPREGLQTVLVMGLDKNREDRPENAIAYTNKLQADFLMLLILDKEAGVCDVLHLNRDTMTEIRRLGIGGGETGTFTGQLALAHTFGSGGSDSCLNAARAVSDLLGGVAVDHYMTLTMDAVGKLNDLAGGVTLTVMEDLTSLDPALEKGKEVTLRGEQALLYVRSRKDVGDSLNTSRMLRQEQYLEAFYGRLMEKNQANSDFLADALPEVNDAFMSDLTVSQLDALADTLAQCTLRPFRTLEGELVLGEEYYEFYPEETALRETVLELFFSPLDAG